MESAETLQERVLILAPTGKDGSMTQRFLQGAAVSSDLCRNVDGLCVEAGRGCGAIVLTDEALTPENTNRLIEFVEAQPSWSDIPIILFPSNNLNAIALQQTLGMKTNATVMERPIGVAILTSMVRSALRARLRQYQTRDLLERLEEADRHKDLFLATLSHELRTPLTAMVGWIRLLKKGVLDEATAGRALDVIERSVGAQTQLIQDILSVSRIITGKFQIEMEPVDLTQVVQAAVDAIRPTANAKNIPMEMVFDPGGIAVMGDSVRLQQIVWNLLSNAIKFTSPKGSIEIRVGGSDGCASVSVRDTGDGIAPEFLPHVFERFRQADSSYTRAAGGLGLGLAIVRHLVELHGGSVQATSDGLRRGATFTVRFPMFEGNPQIVANQSNDTATAVAMGDLSGLRVLLVEDDVDSREMLVILLQNCGAEVLAAGTSNEALELFRTKQPHVVASDIGLPDEDGFELMRKIRKFEEPQPPIPAIALTGFASEDDADKALTAGYLRHLAKPVQPEEFIRVIAEVTSYRNPSPTRPTRRDRQ